MVRAVTGVARYDVCTAILHTKTDTSICCHTAQPKTLLCRCAEQIWDVVRRERHAADVQIDRGGRDARSADVQQISLRRFVTFVVRDVCGARSMPLARRLVECARVVSLVAICWLHRGYRTTRRNNEANCRRMLVPSTRFQCGGSIERNESGPPVSKASVRPCWLRIAGRMFFECSLVGAIDCRRSSLIHVRGRAGSHGTSTSSARSTPPWTFSGTTRRRTGCGSASKLLVRYIRP